MTDNRGDFTVKVERDLAEKAAESMKRKGFENFESYIAHLIRKEIEQNSGEDNEAAVKERLRGLGYLD